MGEEEDGIQKILQKTYHNVIILLYYSQIENDLKYIHILLFIKFEIREI